MKQSYARSMPLRPTNRCIPTIAMLMLVMLVAGCAAPGPPQQPGSARPPASAPTTPHADQPLWRFQDLVQTDKPRVVLRGVAGIHGVIETDLLRRILSTGEKILLAAGDGPQPDWIVLGSASVNAFAAFNGAQPIIAVNLGMIMLLADDQDAWAALFGHELAHLRLDHHRIMKDRRKTAEITSSVAGVIASVIGLPFGSLVADATAELADRAFSRDDERDADRVGLDYMRQAGFATQGAISLQQHLLSTRSSSSMPFLSTHPGGEERIENIRELIRKSQ